MATIIAPFADVTVQYLRVNRGSPRAVAVTVGDTVAGDEPQRSYRWSQDSDAAESVPFVLGSGSPGRWLEQDVTAGISGAQVGIVTAALATRGTALLGETLATNGYSAAGDGGGATFRSVAAATYTANGYTVIDGSSCQWQMVISGREFNLLWFGIQPDGVSDFVTGYNRFLSVAFEGLSAATDSTAILLVPAANRSYFTTTIIPPPGNHRQVIIRGEGKAYNSETAPYGNPSWASPTYVSGSVLQAAAGDNVVEMIADFADPASTYRRIRFENIALVAHGGGSCIWMDSDDVANSAGRIELDQVFLGGGNTGWRHRSYEASNSGSVVMRGCHTGWDLQGGAAQHITQLDIQGCDNAVGLWNALGSGYHVSSALLQSTLDYVFVAPSGANIGRLSFDSIHIEGINQRVARPVVGANPQLMSIHPAVTAMNISIKNGHATDGVVWDAVFYGNGWQFENFGFGGNAVWKNGVQTSWVNTLPEYEDWTQSLSLPFFSPPVVKPAIGGVTGTLSLDRMVRGTNVETELVGNTTVALPTKYPVQSYLTVTYYQGSAGGYTLTHTSFGTPTAYSNTGNVFGTLNKVTYYRAKDGSWVVFHADGWRSLL